MKSNMTVEKKRDILLEDKNREVEKNGNKASNATALANCNSNH